MPKYKRQTGIYWGKQGFYLVGVQDKQITQSLYLPFDTPLETEATENLPDDLKQTALLQKALQEYNFPTPTVNLSLNDKDIIFRSFAIPFMLPHEAKNVIEFEVTKYIPVPMDNLYYAYHCQPVTENNQKNLRVLFFATRKDSLRKHQRIIENAGLELEFIEPNPVSLIRLLGKQGYLSGNQTFAIVVIDKTDGKIIVTEGDIIQFVREFPISEDPDDISFLSSKIFSDIRVSINFYTRQNPNVKINKIIILSEKQLSQFTAGLLKEFGKPGLNVKTSDIIKGEQRQAVGFLTAFSIALRQKTFSSKDFELSPKAKQRQEAGEETRKKMSQYKLVGIIFAVCLGVLALAMMGSRFLKAGYQSKLTKLQQQQKTYDVLSKEDLQKQENDLSEKLRGYKNIPLRSEVAFFLQHIPPLMPEGIWFDKFDIQTEDRQIMVANKREVKSLTTVTLNGLAYHPNSNEQFRLVTNFVTILKNDEELSRRFKDIERANMSQQILEEHTVTGFQIICKQDI